jgi:hypothetical protein
MPSEDVVVREVEDASTAFRRVPKNKDAMWVNGLLPEVPGASEYPDAEETRVAAKAAPGVWLSREVQLLSTAVVALVALTMTGWLKRVLEIDFPTAEQDATPALYAKSVTAQVALTTALHLFLAVAGASLSLKLAMASGDFMPCASVGVAALGALCTVGDAALMLLACRGAEELDDCSLPLVLHWIVSSLKWMCPALAIFLSAVLLDRIPTGKEDAPLAARFRPLWATVTAVPLLVFGYNAWMAYAEKNWHGHAQAAIVAQTGAWFLFTFKVRAQREFRAIEPKKDD